MRLFDKSDEIIQVFPLYNIQFESYGIKCVIRNAMYEA